MNFTFETQGTNTYLVYQIKEEERIDSMSLGMLTNNKITGVAKTIFTQVDTTKYIKFDVSSKITVGQLFNGTVNKRRLIGIFGGIVDAVLNAEEYMINADSILLDLDYIFTDVSTCETILICVPIEGYTNSVNFGLFFKNIMFNTQFDQTENCDYIAKIMNYLNSSPRFSLLEFKKILEEIENTKLQQPQIKQVMTQGTYVQPKVYAEAPEKEKVEASAKKQEELRRDSYPSKSQENVATAADIAKAEFLAEYAQKLKDQEKGKKKSSSPMPPPFVGTIPASGKKEKKEKKKAEKVQKEKKSGLFAGLFKKEDKASAKGMEGNTPSYAVPGVEEKGMAIPGYSSPVSETKATKEPIQKKPQPTEVQSVKKPQLRTQYEVPAMKSANFGETTVLTAPNYGETTVLIADQEQIAVRIPYLIRSKNNEKIPVNTTEFRIGREPSYANYCIRDNSAISGSHANIITRDGQYFLVDTNSRNHSYVNGQMIPCNQEVQIKDGDKIRLANEDFTFQLM